MSSCAKYLYLFFALFCFVAEGRAQPIHIGVNGLTCSQCTRNVEMQLRRLPFIAEVKMDLQHTDGMIILKEGAVPDPAAIAKAVKNAGFSLRFLVLDHRFADSEVPDNACFRLMNMNFQLLPEQLRLHATERLQLIGPEYMAAADYKHWKPLLVPRCRQSGGGIVYFVTRYKDAP